MSGFAWWLSKECECFTKQRLLASNCFPSFVHLVMAIVRIGLGNKSCVTARFVMYTRYASMWLSTVEGSLLEHSKTVSNVGHCRSRGYPTLQRPCSTSVFFPSLHSTSIHPHPRLLALSISSHDHLSGRGCLSAVMERRQPVGLTSSSKSVLTNQVAWLLQEMTEGSQDLQVKGINVSEHSITAHLLAPYKDWLRCARSRYSDQDVVEEVRCVPAGARDSRASSGEEQICLVAGRDQRLCTDFTFALETEGQNAD